MSIERLEGFELEGFKEKAGTLALQGAFPALDVAVLTSLLVGLWRCGIRAGATAVGKLLATEELFAGLTIGAEDHGGITAGAERSASHSASSNDWKSGSSLRSASSSTVAPVSHSFILSRPSRSRALSWRYG